MLSDTHLVVYGSVLGSLELADIEHTDVLLLMALRLCEVATENEERVELDSDLVEELNRWFEYISTEAVKTTVEGKTRGITGGAKLRAWVAKIGGGLATETSTRVEIRQKLEPRAGELITNIGIIAQAIRQATDKHMVLILDDLDKPDLETSERIFHGHAESLARPYLKVVYTIPYALAFSDKITQIKARLGQEFVLPAITTKDRQGDRYEPGWELARSIILKRMSEDLWEAKALDHLISTSNGVLSDLISGAQMCCVKSNAFKVEQVTWEIVDEIFERQVDTYWRMLREPYYSKLAEVYKDKTTANDDMLRELLHMLAVVECEDDKGRFYDVHPAVVPLLKRKGLIEG